MITTEMLCLGTSCTTCSCKINQKLKKLAYCIMNKLSSILGEIIHLVIKCLINVNAKQLLQIMTVFLNAKWIMLDFVVVQRDLCVHQSLSL